MTMTRFSTLLVLPATLWLAASLVRADEDCKITRPGGVKEPGVTNIKENVAAPSTPIAATQMTACPQRRVEWMAQNSILQCQNTESALPLKSGRAQRRHRCPLSASSGHGALEPGWIFRVPKYPCLCNRAGAGRGQAATKWKP